MGNWCSSNIECERTRRKLKDQEQRVAVAMELLGDWRANGACQCEVCQALAEDLEQLLDLAKPFPKLMLGGG